METDTTTPPAGVTPGAWAEVRATARRYGLTMSEAARAMLHPDALTRLRAWAEAHAVALSSPLARGRLLEMLAEPVDSEAPCWFAVLWADTITDNQGRPWVSEITLFFDVTAPLSVYCSPWPKYRTVYAVNPDTYPAEGWAGDDWREDPDLAAFAEECDYGPGAYDLDGEIIEVERLDRLPCVCYGAPAGWAPGDDPDDRADDGGIDEVREALSSNWPGFGPSRAALLALAGK